MPNSETKPIIGNGTIVFDLEADGLINNAKRIHCMALYFYETNNTYTFNDQPYASNPKELPMGSNYSITTAISHLEDADTIIGHNIIGYDIPLIKRLYPYFNPTGIIIDTLVLSRCYHPNLFDIDKNREWKNMPSKLYGRHSLESYGYRLGENKGNFGETSDWKQWSQEMQDYCIQDVVVTKKLCEHFRPYLSGSN